MKNVIIFFEVKIIDYFCFSDAIAAKDMSRVKEYQQEFTDVQNETGVDAAVLAGIASRETHVDEPGILTSSGFSKGAGNEGFGMMQEDQKAHVGFPLWFARNVSVREHVYINTSTHPSHPLEAQILGAKQVLLCVHVLALTMMLYLLLKYSPVPMTWAPPLRRTSNKRRTFSIKDLRMCNVIIPIGVTAISYKRLLIGIYSLCTLHFQSRCWWCASIYFDEGGKKNVLICFIRYNGGRSNNEENLDAGSTGGDYGGDAGERAGYYADHVFGEND